MTYKDYLAVLCAAVAFFMILMLVLMPDVVRPVARYVAMLAVLNGLVVASVFGFQALAGRALATLLVIDVILVVVITARLVLGLPLALGRTVVFDPSAGHGPQLLMIYALVGAIAAKGVLTALYLIEQWETLDDGLDHRPPAALQMAGGLSLALFGGGCWLLAAGAKPVTLTGNLLMAVIGPLPFFGGLAIAYFAYARMHE